MPTLRHLRGSQPALPVAIPTSMSASSLPMSSRSTTWHGVIPISWRARRPLTPSSSRRSRFLTREWVRHAAHFLRPFAHDCEIRIATLGDLHRFFDVVRLDQLASANRRVADRGLAMTAIVAGPNRSPPKRFLPALDKRHLEDEPHATPPLPG